MLRAVGFGAGFAVAITLLIGGWTYLESLPSTPKPWNRGAVTASFADLFVEAGDRIVVTFRYTVENKTMQDYYLPSDNQSVLTILPSEKGYASEPELGWDRGAYIPANQKIAVSFRMIYDYNDAYPKTDSNNVNKMNAFLKRRLKEIEGFAILDKEHRYEIMFPKGWKEPKEPSESNKAEK